MLDGVPGSTDREERGVKGTRGETAVAALRAEIKRFKSLRPDLCGRPWKAQSSSSDASRRLEKASVNKPL